MSLPTGSGKANICNHLIDQIHSVGFQTLHLQEIDLEYSQEEHYEIGNMMDYHDEYHNEIQDRIDKHELYLSRLPREEREKIEL